jgi:hypothetical protein
MLHLQLTASVQLVLLGGMQPVVPQVALPVRMENTLIQGAMIVKIAVLVTMLLVAPVLNAQNVAMANTPLSQQLPLVVHQRAVLGNMPIRSQTVVIYVLVENMHQALGIRSAQIVLLEGTRLEVLILHVLLALQVIMLTPQG